MKKLLAAMLGLLLGLNAWCEDFTEDSINYKVINDHQVAVTKRESGNKYTENITIPSSVKNKGINYTVTSIGSMAFSGCKNLTAVNLPNTVAKIESRAFESSGIKDIVLPVGLKSLGKCAFLNCRKLTSIKLPSGVNKIEYGVFRNCTGLTSIEMPPVIDTIDYLAFDSCTSLKALHLPASVKYISPDAFLTCNTSFTVDEANRNYSSAEGALYNKRKTKLIFCPATDSVYRIPSTVRTIGEYAFWGRKTLKKIVIPPSVKRIADYAFARSGLTSLRLPQSVSAVGPYSFAGCCDLKGLDIPEAVYRVDSIDTVYTHYENLQPSNWINNDCQNCVPPQFPGGENKLHNYLSENILFPTSIKDKEFECKVIICFIVKKDGSISTIKIVRKSNPIVEKEVIRVVKNMPDWEPARQSDWQINAPQTIPIIFKTE